MRKAGHARHSIAPAFQNAHCGTMPREGTSTLPGVVRGGSLQEQEVLKARGIHREFHTGEGRLVVLAGTDMTVHTGSIVAVVGMSGSGKSTLLQILGGLDHPDGGSVFIDGEDIYSLPERELAALRSNTIGFVFQFHRLLPDFNALENVMIPGLIRGESHARASRRAAALLEEVGLRQRSTHRPAQLSGGEQQRVAVARALMNSPRLLLADEPSGNLDPRNALKLEDLLWRLARERETSLVVVTHDEELAARADCCVRLAEGILKEVRHDERHM